eukprot:TRINITY_DN1690_c0_g1_i1.p1 TRINITY_DN1690_c0_g1~~TRINITY_DN1690_c0_g1_i1.p1  ORF type:complete len:785 (+),score=188.16 TRINITY_DN1690_c0_g1_i1:164-2518(+)
MSEAVKMEVDGMEVDAAGTASPDASNIPEQQTDLEGQTMAVDTEASSPSLSTTTASPQQQQQQQQHELQLQYGDDRSEAYMATSPFPSLQHSYVIGGAGGDMIRDALSSSDPRQFISSFHKTHGFDPNIVPFVNVLELLDMHGIPRSQVYQNVFIRVKDKLIDVIEKGSLSTDQMDRLLNSTFPYLGFPDLRCIPLAILNRHPMVPRAFLIQIASSPSLYCECPIEVKRQIWLCDEAKFRSEVLPLFNEYLSNHKRNNRFVVEGMNIPTVPYKRRQASAPLRGLVECVGTSLGLYNMTLHFFRTLFVNSGDMGFSSLRSDLLMALHDAGVADIYAKDPCHTLAWCLDACIRENSISVRQISEIRTLFASLSANDPVLGDLAMIVADPLAYSSVLKSTLDALIGGVEANLLPRDLPDVGFLSRLIFFGSCAFRIMSSGVFEFPTLCEIQQLEGSSRDDDDDEDDESNSSLLREFYPRLAARVMDDRTRARVAELDREEAEALLAMKAADDDASTMTSPAIDLIGGISSGTATVGGVKPVGAGAETAAATGTTVEEQVRKTVAEVEKELKGRHSGAEAAAVEAHECLIEVFLLNEVARKVLLVYILSLIGAGDVDGARHLFDSISCYCCADAPTRRSWTSDMKKNETLANVAQSVLCKEHAFVQSLVILVEESMEKGFKTKECRRLIEVVFCGIVLPLARFSVRIHLMAVDLLMHHHATLTLDQRTLSEWLKFLYSCDGTAATASSQGGATKKEVIGGPTQWGDEEINSVLQVHAQLSEAVSSRYK